MRIRSVTAIPFRLPFAREIALSTGARRAAEHVLVEVTTEDGVVGHAECVPRPTIYGETFETAPTVVEHVLAPRVEGLPVSDVERIHERLAWIAGNPTARAAIELAAFDAFARTVGLPAHRLLGGYADAVACCPMLGYGTPDEAVAQSEELRDRYGVSTLKFKVGPDVDGDIAVAHRLRDALGNRFELYPDGNGRYSVAEAARFLDATGDCRLRWFEEPTAAADFEGRRRLAARTGIPLMADETATDVRSAAAELSSGRSTAVSVKLARTAVVASRRIRDFATGLGLPVTVGSQGDSAIGALASSAFAAATPATAGEAAEVMFFLGLADDLVAERPTIRDGWLELSDEPGFGFEIDPDKVAHYRVQP